MRCLSFILTALTLAAWSNPNRLTLDWLVREDIFAGLPDNDHARFAKGMETLNAVGRHYPETSVFAWRYTAEVTHAVWAHEDKDLVAFNRHYGLAPTYLDQSRKASNGATAVLPGICEGATLVVLADRLQESLRKGAWERTYRAYAKLDELQVATLDKFPMQMKGGNFVGTGGDGLSYGTGGGDDEDAGADSSGYAEDAFCSDCQEVGRGAGLSAAIL